mmetsp:Transcript_38214/g.59111  ORF Transcript_38214/g.59111 Transcript_38214/m.59111 type:complete len:83 (+) Transcript_38214:631-879(+)
MVIHPERIGFLSVSVHSRLVLLIPSHGRCEELRVKPGTVNANGSKFEQADEHSTPNSVTEEEAQEHDGDVPVPFSRVTTHFR